MDEDSAAKYGVPTESNHAIARFCGYEGAPTLVVVGGLHGNEPSGPRALQNIARRLQTMEINLLGRVFFLSVMFGL